MEMDQFLYQIVKYLNCTFEVYLLYDFSKGLFSIYEDRKWAAGLEAFGCITAIFLINLLNMPLVNTVCIPLIYILFVWLNFRTYIKTSFPYCVFYYLILAASEFAFMHLYPLLGIMVNEINSGRIMLLIAQGILRFIIIQMLKQRHFRTYEYRSFRYTKSLFVFPVAAMILLNGFLALDKRPYGNILLILGCVMLIVSNIVIFTAIEKLIQAQNIIRDNDMLALKTGLEKQHFQRMREVTQEYAGYMHDIRYVLKEMRHLAETDERLKGLSEEAAELLKIKSPFDRKKYIEDIIVDSIISERKMEAEEKKICFRINIGDGIDLSFMTDLDKIRIFGNLLDNAIEAAEGCENGYITLKLGQGNDSIIVFHIKNNFNHKNKKKGNTYLSIKDDTKRHGFGIKNVEELAIKYNGSMKILEVNNTFAVSLILSNVDNMEKI